MNDLAILTTRRIARSIMLVALIGVSARFYTPEKTMSRRGRTAEMTYDDAVIMLDFIERNKLDDRAIGNYVNTLNL